MKTPAQVVQDVERRLARTWSTTLVDPAPAAWPHEFPIGQPGGISLADGFASTVQQVTTWRTWAAGHNVVLRFRGRRVMGTPQELPTHVVLPDIDTAATLCAGDWPARLARGRARAAVLQGKYSHLPDPSRVLASVDGLADVDFDLLCRAADWFASHDASGLTPRQVPIEGLHAKWLNTRQQLVRELAGIADLALLPDHPARIHFTYLDPRHRAAGGRLHDSATVGDAVAPAYQPQVVVISENKDTAIHFPELAGGISIEGVGRGGGTVAAFDWITRAPQVFYWGDMDADGLEILNGFRAAGVPARSILMNPAAYETWERFGTNTDARGRPLTSREPRLVPHLTAEESQLYFQLVLPTWERHRRVEQERIPLGVAVAQIPGVPHG